MQEGAPYINFFRCKIITMSETIIIGCMAQPAQYTI
jgi:hypothetical protein